MPMRNGAVQDPVNCRNHPNASADAAPPKLPMVNISPEMVPARFIPVSMQTAKQTPWARAAAPSARPRKKTAR
jgi:hypothetical protein